MEMDLNVCKMICTQLESGCYQVDSLVAQNERGGGPDGKGGVLPLPVSSMHNFVNKLIRDGFYADCQNKLALRTKMESIVPGSTVDIIDADATTR